VTVATEVGTDESGAQAAQPMQPNFVLMKLPGEAGAEFVEILAVHSGQPQQSDWLDRGRSDGEHYGTRLSTTSQDQADRRPLQIEARIDQNAQLSGQCALEPARLACAS